MEGWIELYRFWNPVLPVQVSVLESAGISIGLFCDKILDILKLVGKNRISCTKKSLGSQNISHHFLLPDKIQFHVEAVSYYCNEGHWIVRVLSLQKGEIMRTLQ